MQWITLPGLSPYLETVSNMERKLAGVIDGSKEQCIYLLEHEEVYSAGTSASSEELLKYTSIPIVQPGRGGKFTYHGPGQRVVYPILNLVLAPFNQDLKRYISFLEKWMINIASCYKLEAKVFNNPTLVGVWVDTPHGPCKIAAIGIRVKKWVSYHGVAFNISTDLSKYKTIIPCGIQNLGVTSLQDLGVETSVEEWDNFARQEFDRLRAQL